MLPDRVSNPGPLTYESGVLPIALRGPAPCLLTLLYSERPKLYTILVFLSAIGLMCNGMSQAWFLGLK